MGSVEHMNWDAVRVFLAVARAGSISGAAQELGINTSTVMRRIKRMEDELGVTVFDRMPTGYELNDVGRDLLALAQRIDLDVSAFQLRARGHSGSLEGPVRVTASGWLMTSVVHPNLAAFHERFPGLRMELVVDDAHLDLSRGRADIAFRVTRTLPPNLVGRRFGPVRFAAYASTEVEAAYRERDDLPWIGEDDGADVPDWVRATFPEAEIVGRANSMQGALGAIETGLGAGRLACLLGDGRPGLVRMVVPSEPPQVELWLVTHEQQRNAARVRAVLAFFADVLARRIGPQVMAEAAP